MSSEYTGNNSETQKLDQGASVDSRIVNDRDVIAESRRYKPREVQSGNTRGTSWRIENTDGSYMLIGVDADTNQLGIAYFTPLGDKARLSTGSFDYIYDSAQRVAAVFGYPPGFTEPVIIIMKEGQDALDSISS